MWTDDGSSVQLVMHYIQSALQTNKQKTEQVWSQLSPCSVFSCHAANFLSICLSFRDLSSLR